MTSDSGDNYRQQLIKNANKRSVLKFNAGQAKQAGKVKAVAKDVESGVSKLASKVKGLFK